jgi:integrase/recombinase XerD
MHESTLEGLVADLVALRHAGGYRFKVQERVLRQFAEHCQREGYPDGSITKEALDGFLYGRHLRASTVRRNTLALRQLAEHAHAAGWDAHTPAAMARVRVRHQPPYVFSDEELGRLFAAIDCQGMSSYSNKALVDPVLFRVLCGAGLRISEALNLRLADVDTRAGTLRIRDTKNGESRTVPITHRLAARPWTGMWLRRTQPPRALTTCSTVARRAGRSTRRPYTCGSVATWPTPASRTSPAVRTLTRCATGSRSRT